jgi:hypothetical protein
MNDLLDRNWDEKKAEKEIQDALQKYKNKRAEAVLKLPDEKLCKVENIKGGCYPSRSAEMPHVTCEERCPIRCSCNREENNNICQTFGGQKCQSVKEFWRQKNYRKQQLQNQKV